MSGIPSCPCTVCGDNDHRASKCPSLLIDPEQFYSGGGNSHSHDDDEDEHNDYLSVKSSLNQMAYRMMNFSPYSKSWFGFFYALPTDLPMSR